MLPVKKVIINFELINYLAIAIQFYQFWLIVFFDLFKLFDHFNFELIIAIQFYQFRLIVFFDSFKLFDHFNFELIN